MEYLVVGKIIDTFSLDGSIKVFSCTTNEKIRYKKDNVLYIKEQDVYKELKVLSHKKSSNIDIIKFYEINDVDEAKKLKGKELFAIKDRNDLDKGFYFYSDLIGCDIYDKDQKIGKVINVEEFPAQITLRALSNDKKEFFIPFVKAFIKEVNIDKKIIFINYVEGML